MATLNFFVALILPFLLLLIALTTADEICQPFLPPPSNQSVCNKPQWSQHGVTVAGMTGKSGSSNFTLNSPQGIFISQPDDTLYVADAENHRVIKFAQGSNNGVVVAGVNWPGRAANQLQNPTDVYVDSEGNIFVADSGNQRLQMWAPNAKEGELRANIGTYAVNTVSGNSKHQDEIYVSIGARIMKYSNNSSPSYGGYLGFLSMPPGGMVIDQCDTVYVTQEGFFNEGKISKFTSDNITEQILLSGLSAPSDVILDECGHLFVVEEGKHRVVRYSTRLGGAVEVVINKKGVSGSDSEHLKSPRSLSFDSKWNIYVSDTANHRIQRFDFLGGEMWC